MFLLIGFARSFAKAEWQPVPWRGAVLACLAVLASFGAQGAQTACTPQAGFTACTQFSYSGVDQTFTVPAGITTLNFKAWGAGGGGSISNTYGNGSAGGGYATGNLAVTAGSSLTVVVGGGGSAAALSAVAGNSAYGGGGAGGSATGGTPHVGGGGGGRSAMVLSGTERLTAGGGGGAVVDQAYDTFPVAGAGGGTTGLAGSNYAPAGCGAAGGSGGQGGSSGSGGAGGVSVETARNGLAGTARQGGAGGNGVPFASSTGNSGGGGGGGGYYGGGGGNGDSNFNCGSQTAGGGGSSYTGVLTGASTTAGAGSVAGNTGDSVYSAGVGAGGAQASAGGNGLVVIQYNLPSVVTSSMTASANPLLGGVSGQYYTLVVNVGTAPTTAPISIADTLPANIVLSGTPTIVAGTAVLSGCPSSGGATGGCTVAAGAAVGSFSIRFPVSVATTATTGTNSANLSGGGDPNCTAVLPDACDATTPATSVYNPPLMQLTAQTNNAAPISSTFGYSLTGLSISSDSIATVGVGQTASSQNAAGIYGTAGTTVTIVASGIPAGWPTNLDSVTCKDANAAADGNGSSSTNFATLVGNTVTLPGSAMRAGALFTCTLVNARPTVVLKKQIAGIAPDSALFNLTVGGANLLSAGNPVYDVGNYGTTAVVGVDVGSALTLVESAGTGTNLARYFSSIACVNYAGVTYTTGVGGSGGSFTVTAPPASANGAGLKGVNCTITNTPAPGVLVGAQSVGSTGTFNFTLSGASNTSDSVTTVNPSATIVSGVQHVGTVGTAITVSQTAAPGYTTSASCADGNSSITGNTTPFVSSTNSITIPAANVKLSASYVCTFTNNKVPTVKITKVSNGGGSSGVGTFSFTGTNGITGGSITTTSPNVAASGPDQTVSLANTLTTVKESSVPAFWPSNPASVFCVDNNASVSGNVVGANYATLAANVASIAAPAMKSGATFNCTFYNTLYPPPNLSSTKTPSANPLIVGASGQSYTVNIFTNATTTGPILVNDNLPTGITLGGVPTLIPGSSTGTLSGCPTSGNSTTGCTIATGMAAGYLSIKIPINVAATATSGTNTVNIAGGGDASCTTAADFCDSTTDNTPIAGLPTINLFTNTATASAGASTFGFTMTGLSASADSIVVTGNALVRSALTLTGTAGVAATINESSIPAGWRTSLDTVVCLDSNAPADGNLNSTSNLATLAGTTITLPAAVMRGNANITCTFNNLRPTIKVINQILGTPPDNGLFNLTVGGVALGVDGTANPLLAAGDGATISNIGVNAGGALTIGETVASGTVFANYLSTFACRDDHFSIYPSGGYGGNFTVTAPPASSSGGTEKLTCTITNTVLPTLTVATRSVGGTGTFGFTLSGVTNTTDSVTTATSGTTVTSATVHRGSVSTSATVTQTAAAGYTTSVSCADTNAATTGNSTALTASSNTLTIPVNNMPAGARYVCTFTNNKAPSISATKTASTSPFLVGATGLYYSVNVTVGALTTTAAITAADTLPNGITLSGTPTLVAGTTTGVLSGCPTSGNNLTGCSVASGVAPGTFSIRIPINVAGTAVGAGGGTNTVNLSGGGDPSCTSAAGEACDAKTAAIAVVASNPTVQIVKTVASGSGSNLFGFALSGLSAPTDSVTVVGATSGNGAANLTGTSGVVATLRETAPAGWPANPQSASCVDGNAGVSGNPAGAIGTLSGALLTIPAANMVNGAAFTCTFVNAYAFSVTGRVFTDSGAGAGIANDGVLNGAEAGVSGVTLKLLDCGSSSLIATAVTDGAGRYSLAVPFATAVGNNLCVQETTPGTWLSTGASVGSVALPAGSLVTTGGTGYTYTRAVPLDVIAFAWNGSGHADLNFGDVPPNTFATGEVKSGIAGNTVSYPHSFSARSGGSVGFAIASSVRSPPLSGWNEKIIADPGCTGTLQAGAAMLYPPSVSMVVTAGQPVCILVQVFVPATAPAGYTDNALVQASFSYTGAMSALTATYTLNDLTTVSGGALDLKKEVRNLTQNGVFGFDNLAKSGETLEYRITYTNNGPAPITGLDVNDVTPSYTTFVAATAGSTPAAMTACAKRTPGNPAPQPTVPCATVQSTGGTGPLRWSLTGPLDPGASGTVLFSVKLD